MATRINEYDPLKAGSIDGTDIIPHDRAICRALNSVYKAPKEAYSNRTLLVAHLLHSVTEEELSKKFSKAGEIRSCKLITDIVTGESKGYAFIEFKKEKDAIYAYHEMNKVEFQGRPALVDWQISHLLSGWVPRRLGGGWGGRKESGQLRFGCRDRPWHKPIIIPTANSQSENTRNNSRSSFFNKNRK